MAKFAKLSLISSRMRPMLSAKNGRLLLRIAPACNPRSGLPGVVITVADTGHGMSAETIARIYEPFFSTKGATGTGLGLWVSLEIVEKHGGTLRVRSRHSEPGRPGGTVFRFFLPLTHTFAAPALVGEESPMVR